MEARQQSAQNTSDQPRTRNRLRAVPTQARARKTYENIVSAGAALLEAEGWEGFNTNAVAEKAGCRVATMYRYFPDKTALARVIAERAIDEWSEELLTFVQAVTRTGDFLGAWEAYGQRFLDLVARSPQTLAARRAMQAVPDLRALDQEDNRRVAAVVADALVNASDIAPTKAVAVARVLVESALVVIDLATDDAVEAAERDQLVSTVSEMHSVYLQNLGLRHAEH